MEKSLRVISIAHGVAELSIREKLSLSSVECSDLYIKIKETFGLNEVLILSTCNRFEVYYFHDNSFNKQLISFLCTLKALNPKCYVSYFIEKEGIEAIRYLFKVSLGLESKVLGDAQIFGQVKQAYQTSASLNMSGIQMSRLLHKAFYTHKCIAQQTKFKQGAASLSYNAIKLISQESFSNNDSRVLVVGMGQIGRDVVSHLIKTGYTNVTIANRTHSKAKEMSDDFGLKIIDFEGHENNLSEFQIILSATSCVTSVYQRKHFENSSVRLVVDLSSPRSIPSNIQSLGIKVYNVDDLGQLVDDVMVLRMVEIPKVKKIIEESVVEYVDWTNELMFSSQVRKFKAVLEEIRQQTLTNMSKKMNQSQLELTSLVTQDMVQKIINIPVVRLKTACKRGDADVLSNSLNELFSQNIKSM